MLLCPSVNQTKLCVATALIVSFSTSTHALSDLEFEKILVEQNSEFKSLQINLEALKNNVEEADSLFAWQLYGELGFSEDEAPSSVPGFSYDSMSSMSGELGFQRLSPWGLETKLSVNSLETSISQGDSGQGPFDSKSWQGQPSVELRLPLISGGFGRKLRAEHDALSLQKRTEALLAEIEYDQKFQEAKTLFWSTVLQRETIASQKESLERIKKIFNIAQAQSRRNLEASSNVLQARSALEQTELELQVAELRGVQLERLLGLVLSRYANLSLPTYDFSKFSKISENDLSGRVSAQDRLNSLGQVLRTRLSGVTYEENRSQLDFIGSYSQDGRDSSFVKALGESFKPESPTLFVGLQWRIPLDGGIAERSRARQLAIGQAAALRQAYLEKEQIPALSRDLVTQYNRSVDLLALTRKLELTQAEKVNNERALLGQGRSSMYQVLQFELDLSRAKAAKYSLALDIEKLSQQLSQKKYTTYE